MNPFLFGFWASIGGCVGAVVVGLLVFGIIAFIENRESEVDRENEE